MNKQQVKGRATEAKGKIKEVTGKLVGDRSLEAQGKVDRAAGKTQSEYGDIKNSVKQSH